jgi:hypothetical protein
VALLLEHLGRDVAEAARERVELLGGRMQVFRAVQPRSDTGMDGGGGGWDRHAKVNNDDVGLVVLCAVEDVLGPAWADGQRWCGGCKEGDVLEVAVHDVMIVQVDHAGQD